MKKALTLLLAVVFICLAGCQGTEKAPVVTDAPKTEVSQTEAPKTDAPETEASKTEGLSFTTTDLEGNPVAMEDFRDAKLVILNFWEPWCGPCVGEMPDLEKLYENYKDKGLVILGAFRDQEADARALVEDKGITYPILHYVQVFDQFQTGYVPTTVLLAGDGSLLAEEPVIGAMGYGDWEALALPYLED